MKRFHQCMKLIIGIAIVLGSYFSGVYYSKYNQNRQENKSTITTIAVVNTDAGTEVNDALVQWQKAQGRLALSKQQVTSLQSAVRSSELLMRHSSQNYLEVLTARQTLLQAELSVASNRFDEIQGVINLYHALGGGY